MKPLVLRNYIFTFWILLSCASVQSQLSNLDDNPLLFSILDRMETLYGSSDSYHSSIRKGDRMIVFDRLKELHHLEISARNRKDLEYAVLELPESQLFDPDSLFYSIAKTPRRGLWGVFYKSPYSLLEIKNEHFYLEIDPVIHFSLGDASMDDNFIFQNTRGLKVRGLIDDKIYFYTSVLENQRRFLKHIEQSITAKGAIPGQGFYKDYQSGIIDGLSGWDYLNAEAYIGFPVSPSIDFQFGHGKHFIGNGYRSILLQDYGHNYFYLKLNTVFWKLHYQVIFAELSPVSHTNNIGNELLPKKYMASHYLDFNINKNLSVGLYEAVIFGRPDHFEFQYLNPIILYRTVEQFLDSPDNVLLGINVKMNVLKKSQVYFQWLFDELSTNRLFNSSGWWGNKYGLQIGAKTKDLFNIETLDVQLEYNTVRPYTFAHRGSDMSPDYPVGSYSHYNQPLSHPLGANFREFVFLFSYRPTNKWLLRGKFVRAAFGQDGPNQNFGGDILKDYNSRVGDEGNFVTQGNATDVYLLTLNVSKSIFHNFYFDINYMYRDQQSVLPDFDYRTHYFSLGFRANIAQQILDY